METERIRRAQISLEGLNIGDCFGESFFMDSDIAQSLIRQRTLLKKEWFWTDDSAMAFSIFRTLKKFGEINQDSLALSFCDAYDIQRGYGPSMHGQLQRLILGEHWQNVASGVFGGQGSWGNGSAMRVPPIGAYFADDLKRVCEEAEKSAVVTHMHEEAIMGAIAIALAAAFAWKLKEERLCPSRADFIDAILPYLSPSEVRRGVRVARDINPSTPTINAAQMLGNGNKVSCPDTVPFCLFCAGEFIENYEEAMWQTVSALGDRDTTCAIVGGIVVMYSGLESIPKIWSEKREPIPIWVYAKADMFGK